MITSIALLQRNFTFNWTVEKRHKMPNFSLLNERPWSAAIVNCLSPIPIPPQQHPNSATASKSENHATLRKTNSGTPLVPERRPLLPFPTVEGRDLSITLEHSSDVSKKSSDHHSPNGDAALEPDTKLSGLPMHVKLTSENWQHATSLIRPSRGRIQRMPNKCRTVFDMTYAQRSSFDIKFWMIFFLLFVVQWRLVWFFGTSYKNWGKCI